ncbi:hypothetical protein GCM10010317_091590 [Streptomyces mirabilis]|uniref:hypothetical protein n=1 Tax=Streptomyces mirabilis TaxID=68239 RepID=UPI00167CEF6E|nr:hypothetical protein [Streptomyces mirabilis]GHD75975.1 hypothetical protein GCM10010317_091590 [Streptomyces mirabilis]
MVLTGGRITAGVVRVGETVRRPPTPASGFVADLLVLLERRGFDGAPRYLGREGSTDVLSYLSGEVPARFRAWADQQVAAAGSLLRALHDATRNSALEGSFPVVCDHDCGPNNVVFRQVQVRVDAYGLDAHERGELVDAILERRSRNARFWAEWVPLRDGFGERRPHRLGRYPLIFVGC